MQSQPFGQTLNTLNSNIESVNAFAMSFADPQRKGYKFHSIRGSVGELGGDKLQLSSPSVNIFGNPGAVSGGGEKSKRARKKNWYKKSPWRQGFNRQILNGRSSSGFWLVPESICFFLPSHRAARPGVVSRLL